MKTKNTSKTKTIKETKKVEPKVETKVETPVVEPVATTKVSGNKFVAWTKKHKVGLIWTGISAVIVAVSIVGISIASTRPYYEVSSETTLRDAGKAQPDSNGIVNLTFTSTTFEDFYKEQKPTVDVKGTKHYGGDLKTPSFTITPINTPKVWNEEDESWDSLSWDWLAIDNDHIAVKSESNDKYNVTTTFKNGGEVTQLPSGTTWLFSLTCNFDSWSTNALLYEIVISNNV